MQPIDAQQALAVAEGVHVEAISDLAVVRAALLDLAPLSLALSGEPIVGVTHRVPLWDPSVVLWVDEL